jgi:AcrR family transcriptional regulator
MATAVRMTARRRRPAMFRKNSRDLHSRLWLVSGMPSNQLNTSAPLGLRERKKLQTRETIAETATAMFDKRGFDKVTVVEIADAANVSVKTLFKYFETKEDLLFSDENEFRDRILASVRNRLPGQSALDGIRQFFKQLTLAPGDHGLIEGLEGLRRTFGGNSSLEGRLTLMWERYEVALSELLRHEVRAAKNDPMPRLVAAQLISLFRLLTSRELRAHLHAFPQKDREKALDSWIRKSLNLVGGGIDRYAIRGSR